MTNQHNSETLARIEKAREHYKTRSSRRLKGQSRSDGTVYDRRGLRIPESWTHLIISVIRQESPGLLATKSSGFVVK